MSKSELLTLIRDQDASPVARGEAIVCVSNNYSLQLNVLAGQTDLSPSMISRLKKCYENLSEYARRFCKDADIDVEACHKLGKIPWPDQEQVIEMAVETAKRREGKRPIQNIGPQGRQSPLGRITTQDMVDTLDKFLGSCLAKAGSIGYGKKL